MCELLYFNPIGSIKPQLLSVSLFDLKMHLSFEIAPQS